ncbi:MAG TPA: hypothetical protein VFE79_21260 [Paraburkholderia sp.]|nr:hypothetical protein [Paraburkholderia sp.]
MTTISAQSRAAQAGASAETSGTNGAKNDTPRAQTARFSAVYKNNVTFAHAHHSHHLAQATSAKARQLASALRKRQAAARASGKRFAPSQRATSTGHGAAKGTRAASAKTARRQPATDRVTRDGRQGGGGQSQQEGGQQNGKQRDKDGDNSHEQDHDGTLDGALATTAANGVSAVAPPRANAARGGEICAAISETLLKLRDGIAAGNVPSADRALHSLMQRVHVLRAAEGVLLPTTPAAKRELLGAVSQRLAQSGLAAAHTATASDTPGALATQGASRSNAEIARSVNLLANLVLLVLERPGTPTQTVRGRHLNAALLGAVDARLRASPRA